MNMSERPKVGVGVFIIKDGKVLMQKRKGKHGAGSWSLPGGHLEFGEKVENCAAREVMEETGVEIKNIKAGPYTEDIFPEEGKHYITLFVVSEYASGEAQLMEPEVCEGVGWFDFNDLPEPKFLPLANLLKTGFDPFNM